MSIKTYIKHHAVLTTLIIVVAIVIAVIAGRAASKKPANVSTAVVKQVVLVEASTFRNDLSTVSVDGVVESVAQVDIKSQVAAPVSKIYVSVGDSVSVGQTIVELQNADIRAQLDQARANLVLAQGQYTSGNVSVDTTRKSALDKVRDSYTKTNDDLTGQIGQFLYSGNPNNLQLQILITDSTLGNRLNIEWSTAQDVLRNWKGTLSTLSDSSSQTDIDAAIVMAQKNLAAIDKFLGTLSEALNNAAKSANEEHLAVITSWKTITTNARASVSASNASLTTSGGSLVTNNAQISAAEAGVKNLQAQLAKTIITSPISGKIAALPLRTGEFASPGQLITTVVGSGGLQIKAYASSEDLDRINKNAKVVIQGTISGVVMAVSPSVNQLNKKVEVTIAVSGSAGNLVVGQNVQAKIVAAKTIATPSSTRAAFYILPIQNVKIIPGAAYVYTLDADSKVVKNQVTLGEVKGDFVEVKTGMTDDMKIISPVYELTEGDVVKL